jgi:hypothetical protein
LETCQYLEDAGLLREILKTNVCTHYRTFRNRAFFSFFKQSGTESCNDCSAENAKITVLANYRDTNSKESHDLCCFFENNRIKFKLIDPTQATSPVIAKLPKIYIHGVEVSSERMLEIAVKGALNSVITGSRCVICLAKIDKKKGRCPKCKPQSLLSARNEK